MSDYDLLDNEQVFACDHCGEHVDTMDMYESNRGAYYCPDCAVQLASTVRPDLSVPAPVFCFYRMGGELVRTRCSTAA